MMNKRFFSFLLGGALLLSPLAAHAQSPIGSIISYQGQLTGTGGAPIADGTTSLTFTIYEAGTSVSSQTMSVATVGGVFNTFLSVGTLAFDPAKSYELGITFNGAETRHPIAAVPVALSAKSAASVSGVVPVANGGTGATTKNFVDLTTDQAVAGAKTFGSAVTAPQFNIGADRVLGTLNQNLFVGPATGGNTTGTNNTFVGPFAGANNTTADNNVFVGAGSGYSTTTALNNTFIGTAAGQRNTTGTGNTLVGTSAGAFSTTGSNNIALGLNTGVGWRTGSSNIAIGNSGVAGDDSTTRIGSGQTRAFMAGVRGATGLSGTLPVVVDGNGQLGTGTGSSLGFVDLTSAQTVAGAKTFSDAVNSSKGYNINGTQYLGATSGFDSVAVGAGAGPNSSGGSNAFFGQLAASANTTGRDDTFLGAFSGGSNTTGSRNTGVGKDSLIASSTGTDNIGLGYQAGGVLTTESNDIVIGHPGVAGESSTTRIGNGQTKAFIAGIRGATGLSGTLPVVVDGNGQLGTGSASSLGFVDLTSAQTVGGAKNFSSALNSPQFNIGGTRVLGAPGNGNFFAGPSTGANTTGVNNTFVGANAGANNTTADNNTFLGASSGVNTTTAINNTFIGTVSGSQNTTGTGNTFIGTSAGTSSTTGSSNLALGLNAGRNWTVGSSNIALGNSGVAGESSTIRIGDSNQNRAFLAGVRGVAVAGTAVIIDANGQLGTVNSSSRRFKQNIANIGAGSDWLLKLRPVSFRYTPAFLKSAEPSPVQYGLIAEEVAKVAPQMVHLDAQGQPDGVDYGNLPVMLLNQIQKQQATIDRQQVTLAALQARLKKLEAASAPSTH